MQRTVRLKLQPTPQQAQALLETLKQHTSCYNAVARYGWENDLKNGVELHKATYYELRTVPAVAFPTCDCGAHACH
jgi:putative transposase